MAVAGGRIRFPKPVDPQSQEACQEIQDVVVLYNSGAPERRTFPLSQGRERDFRLLRAPPMVIERPFMAPSRPLPVRTGNHSRTDRYEIFEKCTSRRLLGGNRALFTRKPYWHVCCSLLAIAQQGACDRTARGLACDRTARGLRSHSKRACLRSHSKGLAAAQQEDAP
jgi:hypothetical protein